MPSPTAFPSAGHSVAPRRHRPAAMEPHGNPNRTGSSLAASHHQGWWVLRVAVLRTAQGGNLMRTIANSLVTTSLVALAAFAAMPAQAADLDAASTVDAV